MSTYLWIDLCAVLFPFLFSFHPRIRFHRQWPALAAGLLVMGGLFIPWDALFAQHGVWGFNAEHVHTARVGGLPLEEWLFFLCIPYACVFTYHCLGLLPRKWNDRWVRFVAIGLIGVAAITALLHPDKAYTVTTGLLLAIWLTFVVFVQKAAWLGRFLVTYAALMLPFLVVNGILTGTGLERPVVWYDDAQDLGVRIATIPVEDVFYGLLMVLMVVTVYEAVHARVRRTTDR